jgi:hypothetical protein
MFIFFGDDNLEEYQKNHTVLELDTFRFVADDRILTAYCVVDQIPILEMAQIEIWRRLHEQLIKNYQARNWEFCVNAIDQLSGRWGGEVDSFYTNLKNRVNDLKSQEVGSDWSPMIEK